MQEPESGPDDHRLNHQPVTGAFGSYFRASLRMSMPIRAMNLEHDHCPDRAEAVVDLEAPRCPTCCPRLPSVAGYRRTARRRVTRVTLGLCGVPHTQTAGIVTQSAV
jgi:hypothetical protein